MLRSGSPWKGDAQILGVSNTGNVDDNRTEIWLGAPVSSRRPAVPLSFASNTKRKLAQALSVRLSLAIWEEIAWKSVAKTKQESSNVPKQM